MKVFVANHNRVEEISVSKPSLTGGVVDSKTKRRYRRSEWFESRDLAVERANRLRLTTIQTMKRFIKDRDTLILELHNKNLDEGIALGQLETLVIK